MNDFQENMFKILFLTTYFKIIKIDENKLLFIYFVNNFVNNNRSIPNHLTCKKKKKEKISLTFHGLLGGAKTGGGSSPSSPVIAQRLWLTAPAAQRILFEAIRVVEGITIGLLPFDYLRTARLTSDIIHGHGYGGSGSRLCAPSTAAGSTATPISTVAAPIATTPSAACTASTATAAATTHRQRPSQTARQRPSQIARQF